MENSAKILIDMDGVVCDFVTAICAAHNRPDPYKNGFVGHDMEKAWGMTHDEFWEPSNNTEFWSNIEKFPWADSLLQHCENLVGLENIAFCTSPSKSPFCIIGKTEWLDRHFPKVSRIFTKQKQFCANHMTVLVDDTDSKIQKFIENSGLAVKFPPPCELDINTVLERITAIVTCITINAEGFREM